MSSEAVVPCERAEAALTRLDAFDVTGPTPCCGTLPAGSANETSPDLDRRCSGSTQERGGWSSADGRAYHWRMDQLAVAPSVPITSPPRSKADETMRRVLRVPDDQAPIDESETHRIFSASIFLSALRCLLSYIVLPVVLPAIGVARGVGPAIGIPVGLLALTFDYLGIRRFWMADHRQRWAFTALYGVVGAMVLTLVIVDFVDLIG